ncbi:MAG: ribonuclease III [Alphaproteobacteria bacterium]|nr:ribonuclease III [Alphaproteobacteria bacterium]
MVRPAPELQPLIGYTFQDQKLLQSALTHSSAKKKNNYERLEFLGDRVLGLIIAELLYQRFPEEPEGDLARRQASLVQGETVARISTGIALADFMILSDAERGSGGMENDNILSDVYEALLGAMYLDGGLEPCRKLISEQWADVLDLMIRPPMHPKTEVQEWAQGRGLPLPLYEIIEQSGPDHAPSFKIGLSVQGFKPVQAKGRSRQDAEKEAARKFIAMNIRKEP